LVRLIALIGALIAIAGAAGSAAADSRIVSPADFAAALSAAKFGDALVLEPGIYRGPFTITTPSLQISGDPRAIVDGGGRGTALTISANDVTVSGITVRGSGRNLADNDATILIVEAHGVRIRGCRVESSGFGIYVRGGGDLEIADNVVRGDAALNRSRRGNAIHLWHSENVRVIRNDIADSRDGLYLSFAHHNLVEDNHATRVRYGVHSMYSDGNTLRRNRLEGCLGGAAFMFAKRDLMERNEVAHNRRFGVLLLSIDNSRLADNTIAHNDRGFVIENSNSDQFEGNRIAENGIGAFVTAGSEDNLFASNRFDGNLVQAYVVRAGFNRWARNGHGNYWSDYVGADLDGNGIGETPYRLQDATAALLATRPEARWFMMSPALAMLEWFQQRIIGSGDTYIDPAPLVEQARR